MQISLNNPPNRFSLLRNVIRTTIQALLLDPSSSSPVRTLDFSAAPKESKQNSHTFCCRRLIKASEPVYTQNLKEAMLVNSTRSETRPEEIKKLQRKRQSQIPDCSSDAKQTRLHLLPFYNRSGTAAATRRRRQRQGAREPRLGKRGQLLRSSTPGSLTAG